MITRSWPVGAALVAASATVWSAVERDGRADDPAPGAASATPEETRYLSYQLMTGLPGYAGPPPMPGRSSLGKAQLGEFVRDLSRAIGRTGDGRHKLCFAVGPLCFDMPDEETRQFIRDAFAVARESDVAVAFHIDDSMTWGRRKDLLSNAENIETAGWNEGPNTGRRADWGSTTKQEEEMEITRVGSQPSAKGPARWFTGTVRVAPLFQAKAPARAAGAGVTFEPGARTAWHTHPLGQPFIITAARGWVRRDDGPVEEVHPGDVIWSQS